ncbi:uncharacterized protein UV8b_01383 [Ustilaginoidea virens]|uniref:MYND-type domain-containing protein n=2 Tax=Ustilaginoidea virens TaxID=1159556 RepID=A0A8E5HKT9_USTVR|nr:uncharacterized protein UV8b_01383 [Ustilaginoidea virens]QUC17142.1 hypothetical protein UV8b_01383 [Ustilaginoidea virens]
MLNPTFANRLSWLYAVGNTPATSLTRNVPIGSDVDVLSLGCGDVRNILYTSYTEASSVPRKIDITCCDYDEKIIGRNVVLVTLLLDGNGDVRPGHLWDIYYHLYVEDAAAEIVLRQVQKLIPLLESLQRWSTGPYGQIVRLCDEHSLEDARHVCQRILDGAQNRQNDSHARRFKSNLERATEARRILYKSDFTNLTGMRSAAPVSLHSMEDIAEASKTYWKCGMVSPDSKPGSVPNPMFAGLLSRNEVYHYGSDPVLGYHLATAFAPLTENSPLRVPDQKSATKVAAAAKSQFYEWVAAFREIAPKRLVLRFVVADALACCHTLQHLGATGKPSANWYRRQWELKVLQLQADEYGPKGKGPTLFDVVDTSNLSDHIGVVNLIIAASPLLKRQPWATLCTETLCKRGTSQREAVGRILCGNPTTSSLLLGVSLVQYWSNAKCESHVDEMFMGALGSMGASSRHQAEETQLHSRLAWKRDDQFSGHPNGYGEFHVEVSALVRVLFQIYLHMFSSESYRVSEEIFERSTAYKHFHRGSFSSFLKVVKHRVKTDWQAVCSQLLDKISQDRTLALSTNHLQELGIQMYLQDVSAEAWLPPENNTFLSVGPFRHWKSIPLAVAVTVVIPRPAINRLYDVSKMHELSSPTLVASLRAGPGSSNQWHNVYSDVQIVFGTVRNHARDENTAVVVEQDEHGWNGNASLIASFMVPTGVLQVDPVDALVGICVAPSGQAAMLYAQVLGVDMTVFETSISAASDVFVTSMMPGQTGHRVVCGGLQPLKVVEDDAGAGFAEKLLLEVPASESHFTTITGRLDISPDKARKLLQDKAPIALRQNDPFTVDVLFGAKKLSHTLHFPLPVTQAGNRLRVARKSGYVEVVAPIASPNESAILSDFVYPTRLNTVGLPAALNASHVNLDALPILDLTKKSQMQWLVTLGSLQFSSREKKLRAEGMKEGGTVENVRVNFKESLFTMCMVASGLQGGQTGLFAINHPKRGGIHMLLLVSAIRVDSDNSSVVLDAAVIPLTTEMVTSGRMEAFLLVMRTLKCCNIIVNDEELILWKKVMPALAERCRMYKHHRYCEYKRRGASIPLSTDPGQKFLCTCGHGKLPTNFISIPEWETAAPNAVRIAISPTFAVPLVEEMVGMGEGVKQLAPTSTCRSCASEKAKDGGALKRCMRCQAVKYCSAECQKKDWKKHRMECEKAAE